MKGMLDSHGFLRIYRKNEYKLQKCPFYGIFCGDWCPLFEEPQFYEEGRKKFWSLAICKKVLVFKEFIDERRGR